MAIREGSVPDTHSKTALVHEAYLKLAEQKSVTWQNRSHFYALAATMMRLILIDYAKSKHRARRGGANSDLPIADALTLDEALTRLAEKDERLWATFFQFRGIETKPSQ